MDTRTLAHSRISGANRHYHSKRWIDKFLSIKERMQSLSMRDRGMLRSAQS